MSSIQELMHSPAARQWSIVGSGAHHGIAVPLFSLRSARSHGIGEFTDLIPLIDWCNSIGLNVIQLLPLNDTGRGISPYSAVSAFALHPLFLGLSSLPHVEEYSSLKEMLTTLPLFSSSQQVEYEEVYRSKEPFLRQYMQLVAPRLIESDAYQAFYTGALSWLKPYIAFKLLKKRYADASWETWPQEDRILAPTRLEELLVHEAEEAQWHALLQFLCDQQLRQAKAYAMQRGVYLMGDIPILIDRESADVWYHKDLFDLSHSAGAPPDMFNQEGQNWGFPLYRWDVLAAQHNQWWIERLQWATSYYHLYRLDHVVGFFRIWSIPVGHPGKDGYFTPSDEAHWIEHGHRILMTLLQQCEMLPIGEDLGAVPPSIKAHLRTLGICGTCVMRWERRWEEDRGFIPPSDYPLESMTTVSTHDSETLHQWWRDQPDEAQQFAEFKEWSYDSLLTEPQRRAILWDSHHSRSLFHINPLQEYLAFIPEFTWPNPDQERINLPGVVNASNWRYRFRPSLEELQAHESLKSLVRELIQ